MYYRRVNEIERRFKKAVELINSRAMNSRTLAKELGVSRTTLLRMIAELKRRGYLICVVRDLNGWRYEISGRVILVKKGTPDKN